MSTEERIDALYALERAVYAEYLKALSTSREKEIAARHDAICRELDALEGVEPEKTDTFTDEWDREEWGIESAL